MKITKHAFSITALGVGLIAALLSAQAVQPLKIDFPMRPLVPSRNHF